MRAIKANARALTGSGLCNDCTIFCDERFV